MAKHSTHAGAAVCMRFWSNPAGKWINLDCAHVQVQPGTVGGPPVGEEEEGGLGNPWGCGPPSVSSSISSIPTTKIPPDSSPHYLPISAFTPLQTEGRWRDLL